MPYDTNQFSPAYGGLIRSDGNVVNRADGITATGANLVANDVVTATMQNAANATGNGTVLNTANQSFAVLDVQGTFSGTIVFEGTIDGTTYFAINAINMATQQLVQSTTAAGQFNIRVAGYQNVRARISAITSGSVTVYGRAVSYGVGHHAVSPVVGSNMSSLLTFQSGATGTGNGTAIDVSGYNTVEVDVVISATATVIFEGSLDGTNYTQYSFVFPGTGSAVLTNATSTYRNIRFNVSGTKYLRARISAYTSGTVDVFGYASTASLTQILTMSAYGSTDVNATNSAIVGVGGYNLLFDGTNWSRQRSATGAGDGNSSTGLPTTASMLYNGTSWDRTRGAAALGDSLSSTIAGLPSTGLHAYNGTGFDRVRTANSSGDNIGGTGILGNAGWAYNGGGFDRVRVGRIYKHIEYLNLPDATGTTVWTPSTGKKFRLMGISVGSSAAGRLTVRDGSTGTTYLQRFVFSAAGTLDFNFGNGLISTTADNVLYVINNSGATVNIWVTAWGTEE